MFELKISGKSIWYTDSGKGKTIVLLHGYLESVSVWGEFTNELSKNYRVICFDIPGHGKSDIIDDRHSMEMLAKRIYLALEQLNVGTCFMFGHSMGGYVTLMFHKMFPEMLSGFSLFHSHPFADTDDTKKKRLREIELVRDGKKELIAKMNIPNAFANMNLEKFHPIIQNSIQIALETPENGIIANLYAMMNRADMTESLSQTKIPFLYIAGRHDNYIDFNSIIPQIVFPESYQLCILEESGHMGFIEERDLVLKTFRDFIDSVI